MPFIGNQPALAYTSFAVQHFTTSATTSYTLDYPVANENEIRLVINNVIQRPGASYAYSATGTTLTLTSATLSTDTMYAVFIGKAVQTVTPPANINIQLADGTAAAPSLNFANDTNTGIFRPTADTIAFTEGGSEAMRIDSSGNLAIGTTAAFSDGSGVEIQRAGVATLRCDNSTSTSAGEFRADATGTAIDCRGLEVFRVLTGGSERMRIDNSGKVGIGTTSPAYTLTVGNTDTDKGWSINLNNNVGNVRSRASASDQQTHYVFLNTNGEVGTIKTNGSATAFNTSSDYRLKENVNYNFDATTRLKQLKPARFNFKADSTKTFDGFIAHEVQEVIPEAISGEKDAVDEKGNISPQGIDQSKIVPLLTKALQEAIAKIEQLEARLTTLENK